MKFFIVLLALAAVASAADKDARILRQESDIGVEGSYNYGQETENGIKETVRGVLKQVGEAAGNTAEGEFSYTSPEGIPIYVRYVADENGFQPQGEHLPVAPAIPEAIQRAIAYIKEHSTTEQPARF